MKKTENENLASLLDEEVKRNKALCRQNGKLRSKINELEAEVERLNKRVAGQKHALFEQQAYTAELQNELATAKSEAYKEFAERLKERAETQQIQYSYRDIIEVRDIDNTLKELTEKGVK